jgi:hypothetical protein
MSLLPGRKRAEVKQERVKNDWYIENWWGGKQKREVDIAGLVGLLDSRRISHAFVEQVGAMPRQGVSGVFAFGKCYGIILGVLVAQNIPLTLALETRPRGAGDPGLHRSACRGRRQRARSRSNRILA